MTSSVPIAKLGTLALNVDDEDGTVYVLENVDGWAGSALRVFTMDRPSGHGAWAQSSLLSGREVELLIAVAAKDSPNRQAAIEQVMLRWSQMVDAPIAFTVLEAGETEPRTLSVQARDQPGLEFIGAETARLTLPLLAPDPRKYGNTVQTTVLPNDQDQLQGRKYSRVYAWRYQDSTGGSGRTVANNMGDFETWPVITVYGPITDPVVANETLNRSITLTLDVPAGDSVQIDPITNTIMMDGASRLYAMTRDSAWWPIVPGPNNLRLRGNAVGAGAAARIQWRPAWM